MKQSARLVRPTPIPVKEGTPLCVTTCGLLGPMVQLAHTLGFINGVAHEELISTSVVIADSADPYGPRYRVINVPEIEKTTEQYYRRWEWVLAKTK